MSELISSLCAVTALLTAAFLWSRWRRTRARLLLWSTICFVTLTASNVLLAADKVLTPAHETLTTWRLAINLAAVTMLLWGLVWDEGR